MDLTPPTEGFPWDDLHKIFCGCQWMAKVGLGQFGFFNFGLIRFGFQSQVLRFVFFGFGIRTPPQCKSNSTV